MSKSSKQIKLETQEEYFYANGTENNGNGPFLIQRKSLKPYQTFSKSGHWNQKEKLKYKLSKKENRRLWKVFKVMSDFIKTRNPNQCRSHHQKMQKHFKNNHKQIILYFRTKYHDFDQKANYYKQQLTQVEFNLPTLINQNNQQNKQCSQFQRLDQNNSKIILLPLKNNKEGYPQNLCQHSISKVATVNKYYQDVNIKLKEDVKTSDIYYDPIQNGIKQPAAKNKLVDKVSAFNSNNQALNNPYVNPYISSNGTIYSLPNISQTININHQSNLYSQPFINPYMGMILSSNQNIQYSTPYPQKLYSQQFDKIQFQANRRNQWLDCHQKFVTWITKLHKLVTTQTQLGQGYHKNNF